MLSYRASVSKFLSFILWFISTVVVEILTEAYDLNLATEYTRLKLLAQQHHFLHFLLLITWLSLIAKIVAVIVFLGYIVRLRSNCQALYCTLKV